MQPYTLYMGIVAPNGLSAARPPPLSSILFIVSVSYVCLVFMVVCLYFSLEPCRFNGVLILRHAQCLQAFPDYFTPDFIYEDLRNVIYITLPIKKICLYNP